MSIQDIVTECPAIVHVLAQLPWNTGQQIQAIVQEVVGQILQRERGEEEGEGGEGERGKNYETVDNTNSHWVLS